MPRTKRYKETAISTPTDVDLVNKLAHTTCQLKVFQKSSSNLQQKIQKNNKDLVTSNLKIKELQDTIITKVAENEVATTKIKQLETEMAAKNTLLTEAETKFKQLEECIQNKSKEIADVAAEKQKLKELVLAKEADLKRERSLKKNQQLEIKTLHRSNNELNLKLNEKRKKLSEAYKYTNTLKDKIDRLYKQLKSSEYKTTKGYGEQRNVPVRHDPNQLYANPPSSNNNSGQLYATSQVQYVVPQNIQYAHPSQQQQTTYLGPQVPTAGSAFIPQPPQNAYVATPQQPAMNQYSAAQGNNTGATTYYYQQYQ